MREELTKWLFEKFLTSFFISSLVVSGHYFGLNIVTMPYQTLYLIISSCTILSSIITYFLFVNIMYKKKLDNEWNNLDVGN